MTRAQIVTRWIQESDGSWSPAVWSDVSTGDGDSCVDVTEQDGQRIPPSPNLLIVEVNVSDATLAAIKANAQHGAAAVLWEGDPSQSPVVTGPQYTVLVKFFANKFNATATQVRNVLGATANGRTRKQIADDLIAYLRGLPKG